MNLRNTATRKNQDARIARAVAALHLPENANVVLLAQVLRKVSIGKPYQCWEWRGASGGGYGRVRIDGRVYGAHRAVAFAALIVSRLSDPDRTECVIHTCDNPKCCNPGHLRSGTMADNMRDCARKGRLWAQRTQPEKRAGLLTKQAALPQTSTKARIQSAKLEGKKVRLSHWDKREAGQDG